MKQKTRDKIIYLAVGIAALLVADFFYADSHGREMWMPSKFAFRAVCSTGLLAYCVAKLMHRQEAMLLQVVLGVSLATIMHVGFIFVFRGAVGRLPGINFIPLAILEMFLVGVFSERLVLRLVPRSGRGSRAG